ncbi:MAG TPA: 5'-nucleotidase C-terminal domain-containing protein [Azospirillaceae bacterium]|nr:5'-nucleotidase C-terminal domain-containing protein [Azospirillaceae bacterium]
MTLKLALRAGAAVIALGAAAPAFAQDYTLSIIHTNDVHSRVDQVTAQGSFCTPKDAQENKCFGGYPRLIGKIRELRQAQPNPLVLDAGDVFQGSLFYTLLKSDAVKPFVEMAGYHAMTIGNHEFDDGPAELAKFLDGLKTPVVTSNIDTSREPRLQNKWNAYRVVEIGGQRIGIIGLTTSETTISSSPGPTVSFGDHAEALRRNVRELQGQGVNKIIALTHVGTAVDRELAKQVDGIDVYVGGHSHSLLHNGEDRRKEGPYPIVERTPSGAPALVVQSYYAGIFLGNLQVTFDKDGVPAKWQGDTILMDSKVPQDAQAQELVQKMAGPLAELRARQIGTAAVALDGDRVACRHGECTMGNLIADAMLAAAKEQGAQIAIQNGGGIRTSIPQGQISFGQVLEVLPFSNALATFKLTGSEVVEALENGVGRAENPQNEGTGRFPQVAGLRFTWDASKPTGQRIDKVEVRQANGTFAPLDRNATYTVVTNDFMRKGGDGYAVFRDKGRNAYDAGPNLEDVLAAYIRQTGTVEPRIEGRITRAN